MGRVMNKKGNFPKAKDNDNDMKIHGDGQFGGTGVKRVEVHDRLRCGEA